MAGAAVATMIVSAGTQVESSRRTSDFSPQAHQTLFNSVGSGISAVLMLPPAASRRNRGRPGVIAGMGVLGRGRTLQEADEDAVKKPVVEYETQLELFICNPTLEIEGNDAYLVGTSELTNALSRVQGLKQVRNERGRVSVQLGVRDSLS